MAKITAKVEKGALTRFFEEKYHDLAVAGSAAVRGAGEQALNEGRASIAAAGFSSTWQNAWQLRVYPDPASGKVSINAAAFLVHKIPYANIFEQGGTITGDLWLPFSSTPKLSARKKLTPANFEAAGIKLQPFPRKTRKGGLILAAPMASLGPGDRNVTVNKLRQGSGLALAAKGTKERRLSGQIGSVVGRRTVRLQPLFFSVRSVDIGKKFDLKGAGDRAFATLAARYIQALKGAN